ncbi:MAG: glutamate--tRNA ligase [Myxococcota bacterium]
MMTKAESDVRVRFAPSPTGMLHIGNLRTALYNWLYARHRGGRFFLRIEDTDRARSADEYTQAILDSLKWLGMDWDGELTFQSHRLEKYKKAADELIEMGKAYRCYCAPEEVDAMREEARKRGEKPMYNGKCRSLNPNEWRDDKPYVIRFRSPDEGETSFNDLVRGMVAFQNSELDDLVIIRTDGFPTYNFAVVVDDADMKITHVIRGEDHITNTPRQIQLYTAFGYEPPQFAHLPLILNKERKPYSKRDGLAGVEEFRENGFLPEALMNYIARLGWGHGDQEKFSREELIKFFDINDVNKSGAVFDFDKLLWLNGQYIREKGAGELAELIAKRLKREGISATPDERMEKIVANLKERTKTVKEMAEMSKIFFPLPFEYDKQAAAKFLTKSSVEMIDELKALFGRLDKFDHDSLKEATEKYISEKGLGLKAVAQPLRVALTGGVVSPGIFETLELIGKEESLKRLDRASSYYAENLAPDKIKR